VSKGYSKGLHPLPQPPSAADQRATLVLPVEKQLCEGKTPEQRLAALRAFRRAKGLCLKCAEKWSRDHVCSQTVQLHLVQELLELFNLEMVDQIMDSPPATD